MDDDTLIHALAAGDQSKAERIRKLLRTDDRLAEIHEEYQVAARAYRHWSNRDGPRSPNALQYSGIMMEREQELREILKIPVRPGSANQTQP